MTKTKTNLRQDITTILSNHVTIDKVTETIMKSLYKQIDKTVKEANTNNRKIDKITVNIIKAGLFEQ